MWRNPLFYVGLGAVVVIAAIVANLLATDEEATPPATPPVAAAPQSPAATSTEKPADQAKAPAAHDKPVAPSFDVVRVSPEGDAVIAGRATPGATVIIRDGETEIGRVTADEKGEWVYLPSGHLTPGDRQLSLEAVMPDGSRLKSDDVVVLSVPVHVDTPPAVAGERTTEPLAIQVPRLGDGPSRVVQGGVPGKLTFDISAVDYTPDGRTIVSGRAPAGAKVALFVDGKAAGKTTTGANGQWSITLASKLPTGMHQLRADQLGADGKVVAQASVPFSQEANLPQPGKGEVVVQPGNSLWRIARRVYGSGVQYTVIFRANENMIKNPDLIYPGQVFKLPKPAN